MDIFGSVRRFAGGVFGKNVEPDPIPQGPGGSALGTGLGQAQQIQSDINPGVRSTLDTISKAEGTWDDETQSPDYSMRFGDSPGAGSLDVTAPHPLDIRGSRYGGGYSSNASGAYQFLGDDHTWEEMNDGTNSVMSPANQDAAAERLIRERTDYNFDEPFDGQSHELSGTWASIGNRYGHSAYNQPVKDNNMLNSFYDDRRSHWEDERKRDVYRQRLQ